MSTFIGPPTEYEAMNNMPAGSSSGSSSQRGAAWTNIGTGLGNIFSGIFGANGAADEFSVLFGRQPQYPVYDGYYPAPGMQQRDNSTIYIVVAIVAIVFLYFMLKK